MVEYEDWMDYYHRILRSFHFSLTQDEESARLLSELLPRPRLTVNSLENMIQGKQVFIFGAYDDVEGGIDLFIEYNLEGVIIGADGASTALRKKDLKPDVIVTDLDGRNEDILYWNSQAVPLIVHAHGDNMDRIRDMVPHFRGCMATTQSRPFNDVHNFGGFTDGDRCVFMADHFGALRIVLAGFNFENVGKYSFTTDPDTKLRKLKWAQRLISLFEVEYL